MTTFSSRRFATATLCIATGAVFLGLSAAESYGDPYSQFKRIDSTNATSSRGWQPAPGYDRPDFDVDPPEGEAITVFDEAPLSNEPAALDRHVNEFAGENQKFDNGIFSILGRIAD